MEYKWIKSKFKVQLISLYYFLFVSTLDIYVVYYTEQILEQALLLMIVPQVILYLVQLCALGPRSFFSMWMNWIDLVGWSAVSQFCLMK